MPFTLRSTAFAHRGPIPEQYTCEGADRAPPLDWREAPAGTVSFALVVDDPDAPDPKAPTKVYVHWILYDVPASVTGLQEVTSYPPGTRQGKNDWGRTGYGGPCPPVGRHRYFFKLYALDAELGDLETPTKAKLEKAMVGHILGKAELIGTYELKRKGKKR